jgi:hypothetical protein
MLEGDPASDARQQLPQDVAQRSWDEGVRMNLEDALAFARRHFEAREVRPGVIEDRP